VRTEFSVMTPRTWEKGRNSKAAEVAGCGEKRKRANLRIAPRSCNCGRPLESVAAAPVRVLAAQSRP
jgi:hypothetical protein